MGQLNLCHSFIREKLNRGSSLFADVYCTPFFSCSVYHIYFLMFIGVLESQIGR